MWLALALNIQKIYTYTNVNSKYLIQLTHEYFYFYFYDLLWLIPLHPMGDIGQPQFLSTSSCLGLSSFPLPMLYLWPVALRWYLCAMSSLVYLSFFFLGGSTSMHIIQIILFEIYYKEQTVYTFFYKSVAMSTLKFCRWSPLSEGSSWSWSYGSWIYNYLCNQCLSPLTLWGGSPFMARCIRYNMMW